MIFQIQKYSFVLPLLLHQHLLSSSRCEPNPNFHGSLKQSIHMSQLPHRPLRMLQETAEQLQSHFRQDQCKSFYLLFHYTMLLHTAHLTACAQFKKNQKAEGETKAPSPQKPGEPGCLAPLSSGIISWAIISQHWSIQVIRGSPGWWLKSLSVTCSSPKGRD